MNWYIGFFWGGVVVLFKKVYFSLKKKTREKTGRRSVKVRLKTLERFHLWPCGFHTIWRKPRGRLPHRAQQDNRVQPCFYHDSRGVKKGGRWEGTKGGKKRGGRKDSGGKKKKNEGCT